MGVEISSLILSITALIISFLVALRQMQIAQQANTLAAVISLFREYRSHDFKEKIAYIHNSLKKNYKAEEGIWSMPEEDREKVLSVCHLCDTLGALVAHNIINENLVISYIGDSINGLWSSLEDYIVNEREIRNSAYQQFFEHLVKRIREKPPSQIRRKLKLKSLK